MKIKIILSSLCLLSISHLALAEDRKGPPPEATEACEGKSEGDSAEFEGRNGDAITGTCEERDGTLILRPDNPPER